MELRLWLYPTKAAPTPGLSPGPVKLKVSLKEDHLWRSHEVVETLVEDALDQYG